MRKAVVFVALLSLVAALGAGCKGKAGGAEVTATKEEIMQKKAAAGMEVPDVKKPKVGG